MGDAEGNRRRDTFFEGQRTKDKGRHQFCPSSFVLLLPVAALPYNATAIAASRPRAVTGSKNHAAFPERLLRSVFGNPFELRRGAASRRCEMRHYAALGLCHVGLWGQARCPECRRARPAAGACA